MRWATGTDGGADAAGNLTYDGRHKYTYDAWNRMCSVGQAYRDSNGTVQSGYAVGTYWYDGLHRRTRQVSNSAHRSFLQIRVYDTRWRPLEDLHWGGYVRRQYVWGARYIDELVQIAVNEDPDDANESVCERDYYALTNANFNVMALVDANGQLVERYEYTPYGQRTVYKKSGPDDALTIAPLWGSQRVITSDDEEQAYGLNDIGHQGLPHDDESGLIYNRYRYVIPRLGRFMNPDKAGYVDGMSAHLYAVGRPVSVVDPFGLQGLDLGTKRKYSWRSGIRLYMWPRRKHFTKQERARYEAVAAKHPGAAMRQVVTLLREWGISWEFICKTNNAGRLSMESLGKPRTVLGKWAGNKDPFLTGNAFRWPLEKFAGVKAKKILTATAKAQLGRATDAQMKAAGWKNLGDDDDQVECRQLSVDVAATIVYEGEVDYTKAKDYVGGLPKWLDKAIDLAKEMDSDLGKIKGRTTMSAAGFHAKFLICCHCLYRPGITGQMDDVITWSSVIPGTAKVVLDEGKDPAQEERLAVFPSAILGLPEGKKKSIPHFVGNFWQDKRHEKTKELLSDKPDLQRNDEWLNFEQGGK